MKTFDQLSSRKSPLPADYVLQMHSTEISYYVHNKTHTFEDFGAPLAMDISVLAALSLATESTSASVWVVNRVFGWRGARSCYSNGAGAGTAGSVAMDASAKSPSWSSVSKSMAFTNWRL